MKIIHPNQPIKIEAIETEAFNHVRNMIDQLYKIGITSKQDHKKHLKKFDKWLLKFGLKYQKGKE